MSTSETAPQVDAAPAADPAADGARRPGVALAVIAVCQLMLVLDGTVVTVALPDIQGDLGFSPTHLSWVVNAYSLTFCGMLLLGGRAGDILGRRRVLTAGILLFGVASLAGGLADSSGWLLAARAAQGVGAAIASPTALSLITTNFREGKERNQAFAAYAGASVSGSALGLILGGVLVSAASWRWVLLINIPIAVALLLAVPRFIKESDPHPGRFDLAGALASTSGLLAVVFGFIRAAEEGWSDGLVLGAFGLGAVFLTGFLLIEVNARQPITPLHLFRNANRVSAYLLMLLTAASMTGMFFFLTQFVQEVLGYSAMRTGFSFLPTTVAIVVAAQMASQLMPKLGPRAFMIGGAVLTTVGMLWLARLSADSGYVGGILLPTLLLGLGIGAVYVPVALIAFLGVRQADSGAASGLLDTSQQGGAAVGLAVLVTVFGTAGRNAADDVPAGAGPQEAANYMMVEGISTSFVYGAAFTAVALLAVLLLTRVKAADLDPATALTRGA
ncbi:MFS transporter [Streptomyces litchfieldiae]|uniref:MFS transporter n=1 Tax=Streptomyces litchfieldiae TaxID=3075543 RepID=A0ABU2N099_9ACTN|nr:MFS transporter [Streptomyces sp. DSM 44938]MDT0347331.1 MFS transporter [Streptomyces sp. DSM 44938]